MRMIIQRVITLFLIGTVLLLSACNSSDRPNQGSSPSPPRPSQNPQPSVEPAADYVRGPRNFLGENRSSIKARLGRPSQESIQRIQNIHNPQQTDLIHKLEYEDLTVTTYEVPAFEREYLFSIDLSRDHPSLAPGLSMGMTEDELIRKAGEPTARHPSTLEYRPPDEEGEYSVLEAKFASGKLIRLTWSYFLD